MADDRVTWQASELDIDPKAADPGDGDAASHSTVALPPYPFIMGIVGGVCLGLGANLAVALRSGSTVLSGPAGLAAGVALAGGITLAALLNAEIFAGSFQAPIAWLRGKVTIDRVASHVAAVWLGNLLGALLPIWLLIAGGQYAMVKYGIGQTAVSLASAQLSSPFLAVLIRAILGGALMCLALWLAASAERPADKFFTALLPALGITAGALPHVIVSSHIVMLGIASNWAGAVAQSPGNLGLGAFLWQCLAPATIGNVIGAALAVAALHWITHIRPRLAERTHDERPRKRRTLHPRSARTDSPESSPRADRKSRRRPTRRSRRSQTETDQTAPEE